MNISSFPKGKNIEDVDGVRVFRRGNQIVGVHIEAFFWYLFQKHEKFDLVIDEFHGIPFFTPLYVRTSKITVLQEVAREIWLKNDLHFPINYLVGYIGYFFEPLLFLFYKQIPFVVGSNSAKIELTKIGISERNISVIPHGVVLVKPTKLPQREKTSTVVFLGALAKDKGIEDAIKTFGLLNRKGIYNFWIIGKGGDDYLKKLKGLCRGNGITEKVKFWGYVSQKQKFELLAKASVMINPSLLEGFGLVNIEANAVGTPVVAYNSPGLVDSVKQNVSGVIVKENLPKSLAEAIIEILDNEKKYKKMQESSIKWSQRFDWNTARKSSLALVEKIGLQ